MHCDPFWLSQFHNSTLLLPIVSSVRWNYELVGLCLKLEICGSEGFDLCFFSPLFWVRNSHGRLEQTVKMEVMKDS